MDSSYDDSFTFQAKQLQLNYNFSLPIQQAIVTVEQIRRVFGDNLGKILLFLHKNICCGYSLESPRQGDSNEYPQHMFSWRADEHYPSVIIKYMSYLFYWVTLHDITV